MLSFPILTEHKISSYALDKYLESRKINLEISVKYCKEVRYKIGDPIYYGLRFKNSSGGYEIRSKNFKGSSAPKYITLIENGSKTLSVFEGFFEFLSYLTMASQMEHKNTNFPVLNSSSFIEKSIPLMMKYNRVHLYLDNDTTGQKCSQKALSMGKDRFIDERHLYPKHNDLNDWLIHYSPSQKPSLGQKP